MPANVEATRPTSRRDNLILLGLWSFISGILVATLVSIHPLFALAILFTAFGAYFLEKELFILVALSFFALGVIRYDIKDFHEVRPPAERGVVVTEPERRDADTRFVVRMDTSEKVLVTAGLYAEVQYGDEVRLGGTFKRPEGGYAKYLSKDGIYYTVNAFSVEVTGAGKGNPIVSGLLSLKRAFVSGARRLLAEPESSLLAGLIVSGKQALPSSVLEDFRRAGVVHIVVLSGYNVTLIAEFLLVLLGFLGRRAAALGAVAGVLCFVVMSGGAATVVRAAVMVLLVLLGRVMGRQGATGRILLFTAVLMLLQNPKVLVYDTSFQLSFLAMLGLMYLAPVIQAKIGKIKMAEIISATLATQLAVLPLILYEMGNFSTVFLLSNLLILLVVPYAMLVGFIAVILGFISKILAWPASFLAHLLLAWILGVAHFLGSFSFAQIQIENFPLWASLLMYAVIGVLFFGREKARAMWRALATRFVRA